MVDPPAGVLRGCLGGPHLAEGVGPQMPVLPGRPVGLHPGQHRLHRPVEPLPIQLGPSVAIGVQGLADHGLELPFAAENLERLGVPGGALFGQRAGVVLVLPGLQGGLLGQRDPLDRRGWAAVVALERGGQHAPARLDALPSLGPALVQRVVDADNLADGEFAPVGIGSLREPHAQGCGEVLFEGGVVGLGGGHDRLEQDPSVDGQPAAVGGGLDLVRDRDVGVQVGVAGAGVAVYERGTDQAPDVDLVHPARAGAGVQGGAFDEVQGFGDGGVVGAFDRGGGGRVGDRPQAGDALHRGEREVEPGYRGRLLLGQLRDVAGQLTLVQGFASVLVAEHLQRHLSADPGPVLDRVRRPHRQAAGAVELFEPSGDLDPERAHIVWIDPERLAQPGRVQVVGFGGVSAFQGGTALLREGVETGAEQGLHLFDGDDVARVQSVHACQAGADPGAGGFALLGVVGREPGVALLGGVHGGDLPGQVVIARPGGDPLHAHRHNPLSRIRGLDPDRSDREVAKSVQIPFTGIAACRSFAGECYSARFSPRARGVSHMGSAVSGGGTSSAGGCGCGVGGAG